MRSSFRSKFEADNTEKSISDAILNAIKHLFSGLFRQGIHVISTYFSNRIVFPDSFFLAQQFMV